MNGWIPFLYLAAAGVAVRVVFLLLGRWLEPSRPEQRVHKPSADLPPRPPLGDYRRDQS